MTADDELIHHGNLIALHKERVDFPEGGHTYFDIVKHPGGAVIAAINDRDEICLLKQWRHAIQNSIWEFPAGCLEPGEEPLETAKRELEEEAGVVADQWQSLGEICTSPGFSNEVLHLFAAKDLHQGVPNLDDAEQLDAHWFAIEQALQMAKSGEIYDAKTLALLFRMAQVLRLDQALWESHSA